MPNAATRKMIETQSRCYVEAAGVPVSDVKTQRFP